LNITVTDKRSSKQIKYMEENKNTQDTLGLTDFELRLSDVISRLYDLTLTTNGNENKVINDAIDLLESIK